jgi:hypothetical protein
LKGLILGRSNTDTWLLVAKKFLDLEKKGSFKKENDKNSFAKKMMADALKSENA